MTGRGWSMIPLLASVLSVTAQAGASDVGRDRAVCMGLSRVALGPLEKVTVERGPDFRVFRFEGPAGPKDHWWGVYDGDFAQVRGAGPLLFERSGVVVHRAIEERKFRGYLAEKGRWQNHFFGSVFSGTDADKAFFDRVDFSERGQILCRGKPG